MDAVQDHKLTGKRPPYQAIGGRVSALHVVVIAMSLLMTVGAYSFSKWQINTRTEARFNLAADQAVAVLETRMLKYEDALWAGVAAINATGGKISKDQWRIFAQSLQLPEKYPGINGIGVIHFVQDDEVEQYLEARLREDPDFRIFPEHQQALRMPITYIEPEALNAAAVGLDVAHEDNRRMAALESRDTATAQITGPIILVQDETNTSGFLFYAPFYRAGMPENPSERQSRALGAVYAPFVVHKLMEGLLAKQNRDVRFSISDAGETIYDEHSEPDASADPNPMYRDTRTIKLHGRVWKLDIASNLQFRASNTYAQPYVILFGGLLIEALIIAILVMMSRANRKATQYAEEITTELRSEKEKLAKTNQELEQCVYLMSHDLKTPLRGIGGLADMIRDDLEDYFLSPSADPSVLKNLKRIEDGVCKLSDLSDGLLEWAAIDHEGFGIEPISLRKVISEFRSVHGLQEDQLTLSSAIDAIEFDPNNFSRVLCNLTENAMVHHTDPTKVQIDIIIRPQGDRCLISVSDNGPGIEERHYERMFDVFQTLGLNETQPGPGLGLAIVKKTVEGHHGKVSVTSTLGVGSTFTFDWPLHDAASAQCKVA